MIAVLHTNPVVALVVAALTGAALGFLPFNFNPARIILGDAGSLFIGYVFATVSIIGTSKTAFTISLLIPLVALALPILDTLVTIVRRTTRGKSITEGDRGHFHHGWLDTHFTFSFADYFDPKHVQFRTLRVLNDDRVAPGAGFPEHPHRDMEIVTYVLEGGLQHRDSMGNGSVIRPGDVQYMSAGTGVTHSEFNPSKTEALRLLQIWMFPKEKGLDPVYDQKTFSAEEKRGKLRLVASPDGRDGSVKIRQDNELYATLLGDGDVVRHELKPERHAYVQVARGSVKLNGKTLDEGDGAAVSSEKSLELAGVKDAEVLLFDLP